MDRPTLGSFPAMDETASLFFQLSPQQSLPPRVNDIPAAADWLRSFAGHSWLAYGAGGCVVITTAPWLVHGSGAREDSLPRGARFYHQVLELPPSLNPESADEDPANRSFPVLTNILAVQRRAEGEAARKLPAVEDRDQVAVVTWASPDSTLAGVLAAAKGTCIYLFAPSCQDIPLSWRPAQLIQFPSKVTSLAWTGSADGLLISGESNVAMWHRSKKKQQSTALLQPLTCLWQVQTSVAQGLAATSLHADGFAATADVAGDGGEGGGGGGAFGGVGSAWGRPKGMARVWYYWGGKCSFDADDDAEGASRQRLANGTSQGVVRGDGEGMRDTEADVGGDEEGAEEDGEEDEEEDEEDDAVSVVDLPHPAPVLAVQWRPQDAASQLLSSSGVGATGAGAAGTGGSGSAPYHRPILLTCAEDGTVRLWMEIDSGSSRTKAGGSAGAAGSGSRAGSRLSSPKHPGSSRYGNQNENPNLEAGFGQKGRKGILRQSSEEGRWAPPPAFFVCAVVDGNMTLGGRLGMDISVLWAKEVRVGDGSKTGGDVAPCEWLVGVGPRGTVVLWAVFCLDDTPTTHLISAIVQRVTGQSGSPPMAVEIAEKLPGSFVRWSRLWPPVLAIGAGGKLGPRIGGSSTDGHGATGGVGGGVQHGRHRGAITEVAVHPAPGFPLAATLDAHGNTLLWGPRAPPWLPLLTETPEGASNEWVLLGSLPPAVAGSGGIGYERGFARLAWVPVLLPGGASILAVAGTGSVELYLVRRVCEGREGEHTGGSEHQGEHREHSDHGVHGGGYVGDGEEERAECKWLCSLTRLSASPEAPAEEAAGVATTAAASGAATASPFLGVACLPHMPHSAAHSASSTPTNSAAAGLARPGRGERRGIRVVGVRQGGLCVCVWTVEICIQRGETRVVVHTQTESAGCRAITDEGKAGEGEEGAEGVEGAAWEENAVGWLVGVVGVDGTLHKGGGKHAAADGTGTAGSAGASGSSELQALQEMLSRRGWLEDAGGLLSGAGAASAASGQFESGQFESGQFGSGQFGSGQLSARFELPKGKHAEEKEGLPYEFAVGCSDGCMRFWKETGIEAATLRLWLPEAAGPGLARRLGPWLGPAKHDAGSSGGRFTTGEAGGVAGSEITPEGGLGAGSEDVKVSALVRALDGSGRLLLSDAVAAVASVVPDYHPTAIWTLLNQGLVPSARACIRHLSRSLAAAQAKAHSQQQIKGFYSQTCTGSCISPCVPYSQLCLPEASSSASGALASTAAGGGSAASAVSSGRLSGGLGGDFGGFGGGFSGFSSAGESSMGSRSGGGFGGAGGGTSARASSGGGGGGGGSKQAYNPFSLVNLRSALDDSDGEEEEEGVGVGGKRGAAAAGAGESGKGADSGGGGGGLGVKGGGGGVVPPAVLRWQQLQQRVLVGGQAPFTEAEATAIFQVLSEAGGTCSISTTSGGGGGTRVADVRYTCGLTAAEADMVVVLLDVLAAMDGVGVKEEEALQQQPEGGLPLAPSSAAAAAAAPSAAAAAASVARAVTALDEPGKSAVECGGFLTPLVLHPCHPLHLFPSLTAPPLSHPSHRQMERVARAQYQQRRDPKDCALLYMVLDRRSVLHGLLKLSRDDRDKKLVDFLGRDFTEERHRAAALKNAYVLLSQHRFDLAATFFLLGDDIPSAASVCARNLNDPQLALVLCRLREDKAGAAAYSKDVIQRLLLPDAVSKGDTWMVCTLKWLMGQKLEALQDLVLSSHENTNTPSLTRSSSSSTANTASSALAPSHPATSAAEPAGAEVAAFCATVARKPGLGEETEAVQRLAAVAAVEAVSGSDHMGLVLQSVLEITKQRGSGSVQSGASQAQSGASQAQSGAGGLSGGALDFQGMRVGSDSNGAVGSVEGRGAGLSEPIGTMVGKAVGSVPAVVGEGWVVPAVVAAVQAAKLRQLLKQRAAACLAAASMADGVVKSGEGEGRVGGRRGGGGRGGESRGVCEVVEEVEAWAKHCASDHTAALAAVSLFLPRCCESLSPSLL
ncbi:unnamed protein product [Closterium sp. Yama58-4]|nr:unnamed protein product [Closterium sp. Yama58-4]